MIFSLSISRISLEGAREICRNLKPAPGRVFFIYSVSRMMNLLKVENEAGALIFNQAAESSTVYILY
jgi:hypothetical protein